MIKRVLMTAMFVAGVFFAEAAATANSPLVWEFDPSVMDAVVEEAMSENRLAHRRHSHSGSHRRGHHRSRSGLYLYFSTTPNYRSYYYPNYRSYYYPNYRRYYNDSYRGYRGYGSSSYQAAKRRCARNYRSYNWRTDMYTTYGGEKKLCPYVRRFY